MNILSVSFIINGCEFFWHLLTREITIAQPRSVCGISCDSAEKFLKFMRPKLESAQEFSVSIASNFDIDEGLWSKQDIIDFVKELVQCEYVRRDTPEFTSNERYVFKVQTNTDKLMEKIK